MARFRLRLVTRATAADLRRLGREAGRGGQVAAREVGRGAQAAYRRAAPKRSGNLARGFWTVEETRGGRYTISVGGEAHNPLTGFDYFDITRHGHRASRIYPRLDRAPASVLATRAPRAVNTFSPVRGVRGNAALRFTIGGRVLYRKWVRGYHPARDWVDRAGPQVDAAVDAAYRRLVERLS